MVTSITLIRHASALPQSDAEPRIPGVSITDEGVRQARRVAIFLEGASFSKIYTSTMARAIETAKIITKGDLIKVDELAEFNKIVFESEPENTDAFNKHMLLALRTKEFFENMLRENRDSKILIVAHGNVIRYLVCVVLNLKHYKAPNFFIDNASITKLFFDGVELVGVGSINSTAHLFLDGS
ncbi:MAG: histidine phosphatase family protein [Candidatus Woesearchaeota archaeon]